jgi:hypothetical protein
MCVCMIFPIAILLYYAAETAYWLSMRKRSGTVRQHCGIRRGSAGEGKLTVQCVWGLLGGASGGRCDAARLGLSLESEAEGVVEDGAIRLQAGGVRVPSYLEPVVDCRSKFMVRRSV